MRAPSTDYPEAEGTELSVTYNGNGSNRIMWAVACGATGVLVTVLLVFLYWVGTSVVGLRGEVTELRTQVAALTGAVRDRHQP